MGTVSEVYRYASMEDIFGLYVYLPSYVAVTRVMKSHGRSSRAFGLNLSSI